jgi:presenilin-like A22 family membrane protease
LGEKNIALFFLITFLLVQALGLYIGNQYLGLIQTGSASPVFDNPEKPGNSIFLFVWILIGTGVMILAVKFWKFSIRIIEVAAIFFASTVTFMVLVPNQILGIPLGILLALALTAWKVLRPSFLSQNLSLIFSVAGAGAIIGASLGILPSLIFIVLLSVYDFTAVFITKHMVYIAKEITKRPTAFTLAFPYKFKKPVKLTVGKKNVKKKFHVFQLGGGDVAIPLIFSVSILSSFSLGQALLSTIGSAVALGLLIYFSAKKPGRVLPALPFICAGSILGFLISLLIF